MLFFPEGVPEEELDSMAKHESKEDHIFQKFKSKIALEPEQVKMVFILPCVLRMVATSTFGL